MGTLVEKTLRILQAGVETTADLLAVLFSDYATLSRKMRAPTAPGLNRPPRERDWAEMYRKRQIFYSLLNQLKRDGLVVKDKAGKHSRWRITRVGLERLRRNHKSERRIGGIPMKGYPAVLKPQVVIVAFDIPERDKRKRDWLRASLIALGFSLLQKSVWISTKGIPEGFLRDLRKYDLVAYVEIFSVNKRGTLQQTL